MKPLLVLDQHPRGVDELFDADDLDSLNRLCRVVGGNERPMAPAEIDALIGEATFLVAARPALGAAAIARADALRAVIEVSGAFHHELDYRACFARGVEVLSCTPGFRRAVAEMTLAMVLAGARGLVQEHEAFRRGEEGWFEDRPESDFGLYGQTIGFVGYGEIARETHRLLRPFAPTVLAHDPWLDPGDSPVPLCPLDELVERCRVVVVAAAPSADNLHLLDAGLIARLRPGALVVLVSRAHCVDFPALIAAAEAGRVRVATDVFPHEPPSADDPLRSVRNVILSPHRAAAVPGGRQPIGEMIVHDVRAILEGRDERELRRADPARVAGLVAAQRQIERDRTD